MKGELEIMRMRMNEGDVSQERKKYGLGIRVHYVKGQRNAHKGW